MTNAGVAPFVAIIELVAMHFVAPAVLTLVICEAMRKLNLIKKNDLLLDGITK